MMARRLSEFHRRRRTRNIVLAATIFGLAILFYVMSIVRMSGNAAG